MQEKAAIFLCDCGKSLKNIDFELLKKRLEEDGQAVLVRMSSGLCLGDETEQIVSTVKEKSISRLVIGACSPMLKERVFENALEEAGLQLAALSMANIREQCCWAHKGDVTQKAHELIRMAVARVRFLKQTAKTEVDVSRKVLVVGEGLCGIRSALALSALGLETTLLEPDATVGSSATPLARPFREERLAFPARAVQQDNNIEVLTQAQVARVDGTPGDFTVTIRSDKKQSQRRCGAIVVALGQGDGAVPPQFAEACNIISQQELVGLLDAPERLASRPRTAAFVLDLAGQSSRRSMVSALSNALAIKERLGSEVFVFCKNLEVDSEGAEDLYREARDQGIIFVKFDQEPVVESSNGQVKIQTTDVQLGQELSLCCDLLVTDVPSVPARAADGLKAILKAGTDQQGFYQDDNVHLYPVSSRRRGIFFAGGCRGDLDPGRAAMDASSVAARVYAFLSKGKVTVDAEKVKAEPDRCRACLSCIRVCPHNAIELVRTQEGAQVARINDLACDGCGICTAICPAKAIESADWSDDQILAELGAVEPGRVVAFCCAESAYRAADRAGALRIDYPSRVRIVRVPCAGRVDLLHVLKAFEGGAAGVLILGCPEGSCQHLEGNTRAKQRAEYARSLLAEIGANGQKVRMVGLGPDMAWRFVQAVGSMSESSGERQPSQ